jgi:hypothetical protein
MEIAVLEGDLKLINKIKKNFGEYEIKTDDADIGNGADLWITIVGIVGVVFLQGGKINKNLDAWLEIGKKINKLFKKKNKPMFIDKEAAISLALNKIDKKTKISDIDLIQESELIDKVRITKDFDINFNPYNYYLFVFKVNYDEHFIFCIKSNGQIRLVDYFEGTEWNFHLDWDNHNKREDHYN